MALRKKTQICFIVLQALLDYPFGAPIIASAIDEAHVRAVTKFGAASSKGETPFALRRESGYWLWSAAKTVILRRKAQELFCRTGGNRAGPLPGRSLATGKKQLAVNNGLFSKFLPVPFFRYASARIKSRW
jgi:hypothetical protein